MSGGDQRDTVQGSRANRRSADPGREPGCDDGYAVYREVDPGPDRRIRIPVVRGHEILELEIGKRADEGIEEDEDADAEQEAAAGLLGECVLGGHHRHGVPGVDVGDAGGHHEALGAVERSDDLGIYRIGPSILTMASTADSSENLKALARPELEWLAGTCNEAAGLSVAAGYTMHYLDQVDSDQAVQVQDFTGIHAPPGQCQQVLNDGGGLVAGCLHGFDGFSEPAVFRKVQQDQLRIADDSRKDVVQIMGNTSCDSAHKFHFLGIFQLLFKFMPIGYVS